MAEDSKGPKIVRLGGDGAIVSRGNQRSFGRVPAVRWTLYGWGSPNSSTLMAQHRRARGPYFLFFFIDAYGNAHYTEGVRGLL